MRDDKEPKAGDRGSITTFRGAGHWPPQIGWQIRFVQQLIDEAGGRMIGMSLTLGYGGGPFWCLTAAKKPGSAEREARQIWLVDEACR